MELRRSPTPLPQIAFKWPLNDFERKSVLFKIRSSVAVATMGCLSRFCLTRLERPRFFNRQRLMDEIYENSGKRPLLTVSNHISCCDEPTMWGILDWKLFFRPKMMRWNLAAHDVCFTKKRHSIFFSSGKSIPVVRGSGVYQRALDFAISRLNANDWIHIFPEGKVNETKEWLRLKWGIGRMIAESVTCPLVLPMWLVGFDSILPNVEPYRPKFGQEVSIVIGRPVDLTELREKLVGQDAEVVRKALTDAVQEELRQLREVALDLHATRGGEESLARFSDYLSGTSRA